MAARFQGIPIETVPGELPPLPRFKGAPLFKGTPLEQIGAGAVQPQLAGVASPEERTTTGEVGRAFARGTFVNLPQLVGGATEAFGRKLQLEVERGRLTEPSAKEFATQPFLLSAVRTLAFEVGQKDAASLLIRPGAALQEAAQQFGRDHPEFAPDPAFAQRTVWENLTNDPVRTVGVLSAENYPNMIASIAAYMAGGPFAAFATSIGLETGDQFTEGKEFLIKKYKGIENIPPEEFATLVDTSMLVGVAAGSLDLVPIIGIFKRAGLSKEFNKNLVRTALRFPRFRRIIRDGLLAGAQEVPTEILQEFIQIAGQQTIGNNKTLEEKFNQVLGAALAAGPSSTATGAVVTAVQQIGVRPADEAIDTGPVPAEEVIGEVEPGPAFDGTPVEEPTAPTDERVEPTITEEPVATAVPGEPTITPQPAPVEPISEAAEIPPVEEAPQERKKPTVKPFNPGKDDFLTAAAKNGGFERVEAERQGIDPANFNLRRGGRPVFPKTGGLTFDDQATLLAGQTFQLPEIGPNGVLEVLSRALVGDRIFALEGGAKRLDQQIKAQEEEREQFEAEAPAIIEEAQKVDSDLTNNILALLESAQTLGLGDEAVGIMEQDSDIQVRSKLTKLVQRGLIESKEQETGERAVVEAVEEVSRAELEPVAEEAEKATPAVTPPAQQDLIGGRTATQQAIFDQEQARRDAEHAAPPVLEGEGELFAGPRPQQLDVETAKPAPTALAAELEAAKKKKPTPVGIEVKPIGEQVEAALTDIEKTITDDLKSVAKSNNFETFLPIAEKNFVTAAGKKVVSLLRADKDAEARAYDLLLETFEGKVRPDNIRVGRLFFTELYNELAPAFQPKPKRETRGDFVSVPEQPIGRIEDPDKIAVQKARRTAIRNKLAGKAVKQFKLPDDRVELMEEHNRLTDELTAAGEQNLEKLAPPTALQKEVAKAKAGRIVKSEKEAERGEVTGIAETREVRELGGAAPSGAPAAGAPGVEEERPVGELPAERPGRHPERVGVRAGQVEEEAPTTEEGERPIATRPVRELAEEDERGTGAAGVRAPTRRGDREGASQRVHGLDYRITADDRLGEGGVAQKAKDNIAAIETLKTLEREDRQATREEQAVLVKYVGWGGMPQVFAERFAVDVPAWASEASKKLEEILSEEELKSARASTPNAHFTSETVVKGIHEALGRLGFERGRLLEPSVGSGNFIGLTPENFTAKWTGIELDSLTGRIAAKLYPNADIRVEGFEKSKLPDNFYDAAISNVPFANVRPFDPRYKKFRFSLHDFFFAKALDKVKPNGVVMFITSRFTMDKQDSGIRRYLTERAELIGAIRLPNNAFKKNANTEVTTDIIVVRKFKADEKGPVGESFIELKEIVGKDDAAIKINEYFARHPEMMLGQMALEGTQFRASEPALIADDRELGAALSEAINKLPADVLILPEPDRADLEPDTSDLIPAPDTVKEGAFTVVDGVLKVNVGGTLKAVTSVPTSALDQVKRMVGIREATREVLRTQLTDAPDTNITAARKELNRVYDAFIKKHGPLHLNTNRRLFREDPDSMLLLSLEDFDSDTNKATKQKIFSERTLQRNKPVQTVSTAQEALLVSLNERGRVDLEHMSRIYGQSVDQIRAELAGLILENPINEGEWLTEDEYLSGNVRTKLADAEGAAEAEERFRENAEALRKVQPDDLTATEVIPKLGAPWIEPNDIRGFIAHISDSPEIHIEVRHDPKSATWFVKPGFASKRSVASTKEWGTSRMNAVDLIEMTLNQKVPTVFDVIDDKKVVNAKETAAARDKQQGLKDKFKEWLWEDDERRVRLLRIYNDDYNNIRLPVFNGDHLTLPNSSASITLDKHQKDAVWRIIRGGNTLLAHVVGAGKTFTMVSAGMEMKRLGTINKPMYVVPNHMLEQFSSETLQMYPSANILVASKENFTGDKRRLLMSKIATGNWDGVIVTHSSFSRLPVSAEFETQFVKRQVDEYEALIIEAKGEKADTRFVKQLEKSKQRLEAKLDELADRAKKDTGVTFEELGIDALFIDEAHLFKNLEIATKMNRVAGLSLSSSKRAFDMFMKTQYVAGLNGGRKGVVFATGTPISNTMAEMYTMSRYLQMGDLEERSITHFDAWASNFGETVTSLELAPDGKGYRMNSRFSKFSNVPELMQIFRSVADIQTAEMLDLPVPKIKGGKATIVDAPGSLLLKEYVESLVDRAARIKRGGVDPREDNMLKVTTDGRKAAMDMRLINPNANDEPDSKVNMLVENVHRIWGDTKKDKLTQMVFSDFSTPKKKGQAGFSVYNDIRDKLIRLGVPEKEIAFIQDFNKDADKARLFKNVRQGKVRILIGSTQKMGIGTNAQTKLFALHHLDAPWRPSDIEQRDGRILRRGNDNEEIEIVRYVTKGSFDAYMWQILESKAKFISQIMRAGNIARDVEDLSDVVLTFAEIKAIASGNPLVKEKAEIDAEVAKLELLKRSHLDNEYQMRNDIIRIPEQIKSTEKRSADYREDIKQRTDTSGDAFTTIIKGRTYTKRKDAGEVLIRLAKDINKARGRREAVGKFAGFTIEVVGNGQAFIPTINLLGTASKRTDLASFGRAYSLQISDDPVGTITRLENAANGIEELLKQAEASIGENEKRLIDVKAQIGKPFDKEELLQEFIRRQREINDKLDLNKNQEDTGGLETEGEQQSVEPTAVEAAEPKKKLSSSEVQRGIQSILNNWKNKPIINVVQGFSQLPVTIRDKFQDHADKLNGVARGDGIWLIADNLTDIDQAERVLLHETVGHFGVRRLLGDEFKTFLGEVEKSSNTNEDFLRIAASRNFDLTTEKGKLDTADEYIAFLAETITVRGTSNILDRAVDLFRKALRSIGFSVSLSNTEIREVLARSEKFITKGPKDESASLEDDARASFNRSTQIDQSADDNDVQRDQNRFIEFLRKGQFIDRVFRYPFRKIGTVDDKGNYQLPDMSKAAIRISLDAAENFYDENAPKALKGFIQRAKAGLIDRYGLDEEYKKLDLKRESDERGVILQLRDTLEALKKGGVTNVAEGKLLQAMLTGEGITSEQMAAVAEPIRKALDDFGQEAVMLGILDAETFERNRATYVHRVYLKHETEQNSMALWMANISSRRRKSMVGNTFKRRGTSWTVDMATLTKTFPQKWWGLKLKAGRADLALKGEKFIIFDRVKATGEGTETIEGIKEVETMRGRGRVLERVYWPASLPVPKRFEAWTNRGREWEVVNFKGNKVVLWRDLTKEERTSLGEILDARYTIAKTFMEMGRDIATGRFLADIAKNPDWTWVGDNPPPNTTSPKDVRLETYADYDWVLVPESIIPKSKNKRWGPLAGKYVRAPIWRDLSELDRHYNAGMWRKILTFWKKNKTARSPTVHMNNVMSNFLLMDAADVRMRDFVRGFAAWVKEDDNFQEARQFGAFGGSYVQQELRREILDPVLEELRTEYLKAAKDTAEGFSDFVKIKILSNVWDRAVRRIRKIDNWFVTLYQWEDEWFRMATFMRLRSLGYDSPTAASMARDQFLNYDIRAPWINAARATALPFIGYTYRAIPVLAKSMAAHPWKIPKLFSIGTAVTALGYALAPGDEDEERRSMREEMKGYTWIGIPRLQRMPWRDQWGNPVFLDVRRFVPAGDIFDMHQGQLPIPAPLQLSGPIMMAFEFALNKTAFTGKEIVNRKTDNAADQVRKYAGWAWRSWLPSAPWIPGSWYWQKIDRAVSGGRDILGRRLPFSYALYSSFGIKLAGQDVRLGFLRLGQEFDAISRALSFDEAMNERDKFQRFVSAEEYLRRKESLRKKRRLLADRAREIFQGER